MNHKLHVHNISIRRTTKLN